LPVESYVQECLKTSVEAGVLLAGMQGGHVLEKNDSNIPFFETVYANISYGYYLGKNVLPNKENLSLDISEFVTESMDQCINFSRLPQYKFEDREKIVTTKIIEDEVIVEMLYPFKAYLSDDEKQYSKFIYTSKVRLGYIHDIANEIIKNSIDNAGYIDITFLSGLELNVSFFPVADDVIIYSIVDNASLLGKESYLFLFANKYYINAKPSIIIPPKFIIFDGDDFSYDVEVQDQDDTEFVFYDDTALFDITPEGRIEFTAHIPGTYDVVITAEDKQGNYDQKKVQFIIK
jgi:hypothetical protein